VHRYGNENNTEGVRANRTGMETKNLGNEWDGCGLQYYCGKGFAFVVITLDVVSRYQKKF